MMKNENRTKLHIDILTLFPEMCDTVMAESIIGRAMEKGIISYTSYQIRDYTKNRQKQVDDYPYGGGGGMVMNAQPIMDCYREVINDYENKPHTIYMSPQGSVLTQKRAGELSKLSNICIVCGHYEGVDQRVLDEIVDEEISVGDYVLTGGELPALVLSDAVARMVPGVLSEEASFMEESHYSGLLEHPHYTRPEIWEEKQVPEVLISGHHANIEKWRREESLRVTFEKRSDLIEKLLFSENDKTGTLDVVKKFKLSDEDKEFLDKLSK